jgi:aspartate racemase
MKKIGILGGIAWPSTVDYYTEICRRSEQWHLAKNPDAIPSTPEISIESLDLNKVFSFIGNDEDESSWSQFDDYHRQGLLRVEASGADFAIMASNSPHHRFASITRGIKIPVLNLLEVVAEEASRQGAQEVLILGTALAMRSAKFREIFAKCGVTASGPSNETAKSTISAMVFELQRGKIECGRENWNDCKSCIQKPIQRTPGCTSWVHGTSTSISQSKNFGHIRGGWGSVSQQHSTTHPCGLRICAERIQRPLSYVAIASDKINVCRIKLRNQTKSTLFALSSFKNFPGWFMAFPPVPADLRACTVRTR